LSKEDFSERHRNTQSLRLSSVQWLINSPQFQRWLNDDQQVLLCVGNPGSGKTVATSLIVDTLLERFGTDDRVGIAFLYPRFQDKSSPGQLFQSLLYQLGRRLPVLPAAAREICLRHDPGKSQPTVDDLLRAISAISDSMSKIYFVIDADSLARGSSHKPTRHFSSVSRCYAKI
jgi:Cdc6-like AAA superfamily ATPase